MPGSSNSSSFIPKRGTNKRTRSVQKNGRYLLTGASYIVLFTALVASAAVYAYSLFVQDQLQTEVAAMSEATDRFREADMQRIQAFDVRLRQANQRLENSASINAIFEAFEAATIDTVEFNSFSLTRDFDQHFLITADITTDTFDSTIFQRDIFVDNDTISAISLDDITFVQSFNEETGQSTEQMDLTASVLIPLSAVLRNADAAAAEPVEETVIGADDQEIETNITTNETDV